MSTLRSFFVMALGIFTAFVLFWVMQALITVKGELKEASGKLTIDFVRLRKDTAPPLKEREPPRREKPEQPPPPPEMNMAQNLKPGDTVGEIIPIVDTGVELEKATSLGVGGTDRDPVPLVRVDPEYPPRAKQQRLGGWVLVSFTITPVGTTDDIKILDSNPPYVFDRATVEAVRKWRYQPRIENGKPIARKNVQVKETFDPRKTSR